MVDVGGVDAQQSSGPHHSTAELMSRSDTQVHPRANQSEVAMNVLGSVLAPLLGQG